MKYLIVISSIVLFTLTACNQNNTNPNNNSSNCTPSNNVFCQINYNGTTLQSNGYEYLGLKAGLNGSLVYLDSISGGDISTFVLEIPSILCPSGNNIGNLTLKFLVQKNGQATTGIYKPPTNWIPESYFNDYTNNLAGKGYLFKNSSLTVNVTNISTYYISGSFSCILSDGTNEYPATGSFNVIRRV